ncbi:MAG: hypothetical protein R3277_04080 [Brumimicrobium sp.]|nr:hypothetical protein [Brumimicrobium sp.]
METLFNIFLIIHVAAGAIGLISGVLNMLGKKGDARHKKVGMVFYISMMSAGLSSFVLSIIHPSLFLFMVGIFTAYLVGTGRRYLKLEISETGSLPNIKPIDWIYTTSMLLAAVLLIVLGVRSLLTNNLFGIVFLVFGTIGLLLVKDDWKNYRGKSTVLNFGLSEHLQRMSGGFIAALTAFLVVNGRYFPDFIPVIVYWLLPTVVITPVISRWARKYSVKREKNIPPTK